MAPEAIGPYRIIRPLGAGGMGEVFLAEDTRLGRRVAIKRPADLAVAPAEARERLRGEAHAAAQLNHPNVAAIYDVIDHDGLPHIVMEYVEGETLASMAQRGPLAPEAALGIGRQIADALVEAHAHGVIHRDLKPANVMMTANGRVKVLDFGLAREAVDAGQKAARGASVGRQLFGTPGYMAPEQLLGRRADARSDIFSFGALLSELLTGVAPVAATDAIEQVLAAAKSPRPTPPRDTNPNVPPVLNDLVLRALAPRPEDRFQSAQQLSSALARAAGQLSDAPTIEVRPQAVRARWKLARSGWPVIAGLGVLGLALGLFLYTRGTSSPHDSGVSTIVAVLPFQVEEGQGDLEALAAGLADLIVNSLAATKAVTAVPPREASLIYRQHSRDAARVARELGADRLVEGAVRRTEAGIELRLTVSAAPSGNRWERSYAGTLNDVLTMGRRILDDIVVELGAASPQGPPSITSVEAFQQYAQARDLLERRDVPGNVERAIDLLQASTRRAPDFALAQAALGEAYFVRYDQTKDNVWADRAEEAMLLALATDANQPLVRLGVATIFRRTGKRERAEQELRSLLATKPSDAAHRELGIILIERGEIDAGLAEMQQAIDLRPGYWLNYSTRGTAALRAGRYGEAEQAFVRVTELQPDNASAHAYLGIAYLLTGATDKAIDSLRRSIAAAPSPTAWSNLGSALSESGREQEALDAYREAVTLRPGDPAFHWNLGDSLARLNRKGEARSEYTECVNLSRDALTVDNSVANHGSLAVCLAKLGQFDEALSHVTAALELAPNAYEPYRRQAAVLALAGRPQEALVALRAAHARGLSPAIIVRDDDLKSLRATKDYQDLVTRRP